MALLAARQLAKMSFESNPDTEFDVPTSVKQAWNAKIATLQAEIKAIVAAW